MSAVRWWLLGLVLGAGCGGGQTSAVITPPLGGTITAVEVTEQGRVLAVPSTGVTEVDVNSVLYLQMNDQRIAEEMAALAGIERHELAALARRAVLLDAVTRAQTAALVYLRELSEKSGTGQPISGEELARLGRLEDRVAIEVDAYARAAGEPAGTFFRKRGYQGIDEERSRVLARSTEVAAEISAVRWRIEAVLSKNGAAIPIHLPNYDDLPEESLHVVRKLVPDITAGNLRRQLDAAAHLSRSVNRLIEEQRSLERQLLAPLQNDLRQLRALLLDKLPALDLVHRELTDRASGVAEGRRLVAAIDALRATLVAVQTRCDRALALLDSPEGAMEGLSRERMQALLSCAGVIDEVMEDDLPARLAEVDAAVELLAERASATPSLRSQIGDLAEVRDMIGTYQRAEDYWQSAFAMMLGARNQLVGPVTPGDDSATGTLAGIVNTAIQLTRTRREEGDALYYRPSIVGDGVTLEAGVDQTFLVVQAGLRLDVSAALNFIRPMSLRDGEEQFRAGPAITATLHYRAWRQPGGHVGNRLWNFLDPGVGVHLAYPDLGGMFEADPAAEIGMGGVIQVFGDLFQVGYGYDLQVGRSYWYLGVGLHTLADLGISFPVPRGD